MKQKRTTDIEKIEIVERYLKGEKTKVLANDYGLHIVSVLGLLKRRNITIRPDHLTHRKKYEIDETFFDAIDTEEKAYFLGLLYADGYNNEKSNSVTLSLVEVDIDILYKLKEIVKSNKSLYKRKFAGNRQLQYALTICNKKISEQLAKLGCMQAKTFKITFPEWLQEDLQRHFIRGYFDGDGCISLGKGRETFSLVGTEQFLNRIQEIMMKELGLNKTKFYTRHPERSHNIRTLVYCGGQSCKKILDWLYSDSIIYLQRKYDKYQQLLVYLQAVADKKAFVRLCTVCAKKHYAKSYCFKHYQQLYKDKTVRAQKQREKYLQSKSKKLEILTNSYEN